MTKLLTFAFIGGDQRQLRVANNLNADGHKIRLLGFKDFSAVNEGFYIAKNFSDVLSGADAVILPLPYTTSDETINAPYTDTKLYISDLLKAMNEKQLLFAGKADKKLLSLAKLYNLNILDYAEREELAILNAVPTAEGAIKIAIDETPSTIHNSNCLILGGGRIGKILAKDLKGLGANVTVASRKYGDLAQSGAMGYTPVSINNIDAYLHTFDIIFNTAPALILDFKRLLKVNDNCLIIDLASKPGGVDFEGAKELKRRVIWALSLPGKVAPYTAGDIIKNTIINILEELGV